MLDQIILSHLANEGAILKNGHFVHPSGLHSTTYVNMPAVIHQTRWLAQTSRFVCAYIGRFGADLVIGPETLGRTLAQYVALGIRSHQGIWCTISGEGDGRYASFLPELGFDKLVAGKRVAIVDDMVTTGSSIKRTAELITSCGGNPVIAVAIVRCLPSISAADCSIPELRALATLTDCPVFTPEQCATRGPCADKTPMALRPGDGWKWIKSHAGYPVA